MSDTPKSDNVVRTARSAGRGPIGTSLFGGAILASVATASLTQVMYLNSITALNGISVASGTYVVAGGYNSPGDGGGGTFLPGDTTASTGSCTPDGGLVFQDGATPTPHCFYRANPTNSVREWGALCDVQVVAASSMVTVSWTAGTPGTLTVSPTLSSLPAPGENIAISQIGAPTLWGTSLPAVSMTRFSILGGAQGNYSVGDVISFTGPMNPGSFSQQAAIVVDAVSGGTITQWHFLWGGLYNATVVTDGTFSQDDARSFCHNNCGTTTGYASGATMVPAWSGWSVLNSQSISSAGTGYTIGQMITLTGSGAMANQGHLPQLIVEGTTTSGGVNAFDWIDFGSLNTLPTTTTTLTDQAGGAHPLVLSPVSWTQGPFATTVVTATNSGTIQTNITLTDTPAFPGSMPIQYFYYGHDDYTALNRAIQAAPKGGLVIPGRCGTTRPINLTPTTAATNASSTQNLNTFLTGANLQSSGLFAFAAPLTMRSTSPVLAHVIYSGVLNSGTSFAVAPGGGFSNMFVEGLGIPEGYGYYGQYEGTTAPTGYVGPTSAPYDIPAAGNVLPAAGNVVEIDAASLMHIDKVLISNGGIGPGNSVLQCGFDESDPGHHFVTTSIANIVLTDARIDGNSAFSGPTDPDFILRLDASCHDSVYDGVAAYDGTKADILAYNGNLFNRMHVNSDAANTATGALPTITWPSASTFGLAGLAAWKAVAPPTALIT